MNGDGVKTTAKGKHVYFDHDGNGFAENTGWVDSNDALLVLDRNQNGLIDNGSELFGNNTLLASGEKAKNGFEALAEFDENHDGVIDANDAIWSKLQLWQDKNQNGVVDDNELIAIKDSQITGIGINYSNKKEKDIHGNEHRESAQVTWADGHQTDATDVWFKTDLGDSYIKDSIEIDKDIALLPFVHGFGNVPNLHYAMQKDPSLKELVKTYLAADRETRINMLDDIIYKWTGSYSIESNSRGEHFDARKLVTLENLTGSKYIGVWCDGSPDSNPHKKAAPTLIAEYNDFADYVSASLLAEGVYKELFFPIILIQWDKEKQIKHYDFSKLNNEIERLVSINQIEEAKELVIICKNLGIYNSSARNRWLNNLINVSFENELVGNFYRDIGKDIGINLGSSKNDNLYGSSGSEIVIGGTGNDYMEGGYGNDTYVFAKGHGHDIISDSSGSDSLKFLDINFTEVKFYKSGNDLIIKGYNDGDSITVKHFFFRDQYEIENFEFKDKTITLAQLRQNGMELYGTGGDDDFYLTNGRAILHGEEGDDILKTGIYDDVLDGGAGDDKLYAYDGNDTLIGGAGNDYMEGGYGNDTYVFAKGHGHDTIFDQGGLDTLQFTDINFAEVKFGKSGDNLIIFGYNDGDSITVEKFFSYYEYYLIEKFVFKDKAITVAEMRQRGFELHGTAGNDDISLTDSILSNSKAILHGDEGNDTLFSGRGDDVLDGGAGDDKLYGYDGNDTLIGGTGNDYMEGGFGNDTYVFAKGHGHDTIYDQGGSDTLQFTDINFTDVKFRKNGNDLIIYGYNDGDSITVKKFFYSSTSGLIENFVFKDKTVTLAEMHQKGFELYGTAENDNITYTDGNIILRGEEGNDTLRTGSGDDVLDGGAGDDKLYGYNGNDTLIGGAGNDYMEGGYGNDTYVFAKGHGHDTIYDQGGSDTLQFTDINFTDVKFRKNGDHLTIYGYNDGDSITVEKFFYSSNSGLIENFVFKDKAVTLAEMRQKGFELYGTAGNDDITYTDGNVILRGEEGNDTLRTGSGDDVLDGGAGDDKLYGYNGNDTLIGGAGNDYMEGGYGNDTYVFAKGHGHDTIYDQGGSDTLQFTDINFAEVKFGKSGDNLIIFGYNDGDSITVEKFFSYYEYYLIEKFVFKDKAITVAEMRQRGFELHGTAGNDDISLTDSILSKSKAILRGDEGNDTLRAGNNDVVLDGGAGDDTLYGYNGNDTLIGGTGNDYMEGGHGNDTYVFAKDHGQDTINDSSANHAFGNKIAFQDYNSDELWFSREYNNLVIRHIGTDDQVVVKNWFYSNYYRQFRIETADDKEITAAQVQNLLSAMAGFSVNTTDNMSTAEQMHLFNQQNTISAYWGS